MKKRFALPLVVLAALALMLVTALAQPGDLDPTWGDEGLAFADFSGLDDAGYTHILQPDGKLVMGGWADVWPGDFGAVRYMPDGSLDATFGNGGRVTTAFADDPELVDAAYASNARPNGGFHLFGETCDADYIVCDLAAAAYLEDGSLDTSFGGDGRVTTDVGTEYGALSWPRRNILQSDGKLVAAGVIYQDDGDVDIVLVRYNSDGSLDDTFSDDGLAILDFEDQNNYPQDIMAAPGGKIMIAGAFGTPLPNGVNYYPETAMLARVNEDGSLDDTFGGGDGYFTWQYNGGPTTAQYMVITPADDLMLLGWVPGAGDAGDCTLQRYDLDGNLDQTFGNNGWVMIDTGQDDYCWQMEMTPDGGLAFAGNAYPPTPPDLRAGDRSIRGIGRGMIGAALGATIRDATAMPVEEPYENFIGRYHSNGTPNTTFGEDGLVRISFSEGSGLVDGLAVQPNGKIITRGNGLNGDSVDFAALRLLDDLPVLANPGALDPTWGDEGLTITDFDRMDDYANASALMDDGRWVVVGWANIFPGDFGAARYLANGKLDPTFGDGGKVVTAFTDDPDLVDAAWAAGARSNGGFFAIGETCDADYIICQLAVAAYNADGSLDETFGEDGLVTTDPGTGSSLAWPHRVIVQPDEKLVIGGIVFQDDDAVDLVFVRYHPDGSLDDTFGVGGIAISDLAGVDNFVQSLVALPGDKFLAVGGFGAFIDPINNDPDAGFLARMNSNGSLDTTFAGGNGYVTWDNDGAMTQGREVLVTPDNRIIVLGQMATDDGVDCTLQRFDMDGNLDTTFGDEGLVVIDSGQSDECLKMGLTPDGKLAIAGPSVPAESSIAALEDGVETTMRHKAMRTGRTVRLSTTNSGIGDDPNGNLLARYNLDGTPDATFGTNGLVHFSINEGDGFVYNLAVQRDGKILVAGDVLIDDFLDFGVLRFLGDGPAAQVYAPVVGR